MNRPLKFRVWDLKNKYWLNPSALRCGHNDNSLIALNMDEKDYVIQQCVGIRDKFGHDIYEGDLVKLNYANWINNTGEVIYWYNGFYINCDGSLVPDSYYQFEHCCVVGNIFDGQPTEK